jgi:beta-lactamase superfamily II metal-dependent hydrolase
LLKIHFKNVGQGDSIIVEWDRQGQKCIGIIDCNIYEGSNPTLDYLTASSITSIEFIILSHFHVDHFSGMADVFNYCIQKNIRVKFFYHTVSSFLSEIYNQFYTQNIYYQVEKFIKSFDPFVDSVSETILAQHYTKDHRLTENITLSFLAPQGQAYDKMAKQVARKVIGQRQTLADINKLSTIISIQSSDDECVLLTSDAAKRSFTKLRNYVSTRVLLVQVPHHGSKYNLDEKFWQNIKKQSDCPAVFSVGDVPKDKLPHVETVEFFTRNNFSVHSTNNVYGINEYFGGSVQTSSKQKTTILNNFSKLRKLVQPLISSSKYSGDQIFEFF